MNKATTPPLASHDVERKIFNRLKRAQGHLKKVVEMMHEHPQPAPIELVQQLQAVIGALNAAKSDYVKHSQSTILTTLVSEHAPNQKPTSEVTEVLTDFWEMNKYL